MSTAGLLVVISLLGCVHISTSITCYSCASLNNQACNDPANNPNLSTCDGSQCTSTFITVAGFTTVARACLSGVGHENGCQTSSTSSDNSGKICYCSTDRCNIDTSGGTGNSAFNTRQLSSVLIVLSVLIPLTAAVFIY